MKRLPDRNIFIKMLRLAGYLLPGDYLKTIFYLYCIKKPRMVIRKYILSFYRMEPIYDVLGEFSKQYKGPFSILEFGTASGYSTAKMLYATRYLKLEDKVTVHAFDSFEGLSESTAQADSNLISNTWEEGYYQGDLQIMNKYIQDKGYSNIQIHKGYFEDTLTPELIENLKLQKPILIWVDCDYYSSAKTVFERLLPILPTGSVFYFDDYDFNFCSRFTGEARLVHEINIGKFGEGLELRLDTALSLDSLRVYRFIRYGEDALQFEVCQDIEWKGKPRPIGNGSLLPG